MSEKKDGTNSPKLDIGTETKVVGHPPSGFPDLSLGRTSGELGDKTEAFRKRANDPVEKTRTP